MRELLSRGAFLLLEDADGALAGCVYVETGGERGSFGMLSVDPAQKARGLGRRLVAAAEAACRARGCRHLDLQVVSLREELFPFYRRLGYVEAGTAPFPETSRLKRPCHMALMTKRLA